MSEVLPPTGTAVSRIEALLYDRIGLDPTTVGSSLVERAMQRRMSALGITSTAGYLAALGADAQEIQELVEEVVVPETYFFRESEGIDAIAARLANGSLAMSPSAPVRVLSAPCSTGEEPYSLAMKFLDAGVAPNVVRIDAVDVSREAVRRARAAVYRKNAFRGSSEAWCRFFDTAGAEFTVKEEVRRLVRIVQANLLDPGFNPPEALYDVIFCRNLLIYFDVETQSRVLGTMTKHLAPNGILVVGAADTFAVRRAGFSPVRGEERAFLFVRAAETDAAPVPVRQRRPAPKLRPAVVGKPAAKPARARSPHLQLSNRTVPSPPPPGPGEIDILDVIGVHANAGRLDDALRIGEGAAGDAHAEDASLHALLGTLYSARNDTSNAEMSYRRALYIDPEHADALSHLALLVAERGDHVAASRLRERAMRAHAKDRDGGKE